MPTDLPDDHRQWPTDPFALLGVERGAEGGAIRVAYTRLIRRYKPEHHPDAFAKIREAYEACREQSSWYRSEPETAADESISVRAERPVSLPPLRNPAAPDAVESLWLRAVAGDLDGAYRGLATEALQNGSVDLSLRLYWLLSFDPKLDGDRTRHEWLLDALMRSRLQGSALELYRRELEADAAVALGEPYTELFDLPAESPQLLALAHFVIPAAARSDRFARIESDLINLKRRLGVDHDGEWLALLAAVVDWAVWGLNNGLLDVCQRELQALKHLELQNAYLFDRMEQAQYWGVESSLLGPRLGKFRRLLGILWSYRGRVGRAELLLGLRGIAEQPYASLQAFDDCADFLGNGFGSLALDLLGRYLPHPDDNFPPDILRGYIRRVLPDTDAHWGGQRIAVLDWLIRDRIDPAELIDACGVDKQRWIRNIAGYLRADLSLRLVWLSTCICSLE